MAQTQIRGSTQILAGSILDAQIAPTAAIATSKLADGANFLKKDGSVALTASLSAGGNSITNLAAPVNATDAVTKAYVDATTQGLDPKASVRAATNGSNISLTGTQTIDSVALSVGDRVLVKDQTTASANGIYVVASGAWTRATDADASAKVTPGMFTFVEEGSQANQGWVLAATGTVVLGTTNLPFVQFSGAGEITAGAGLAKNGNTLSVDSTVVTLTGAQTLTNKSIAATQLTGALPATNFPALTGDVTSTAGSLGTTIAPSAVGLTKLANLPANTLIGNSTVVTNTPTAVSMTSTPNAYAVSRRDGNANESANNFIGNVASTATAAGTTTLTVASARLQQFTGTQGQTVVLPDATTLAVGQPFFITNRSTGSVAVNTNGGALLQTMAAGSQLEVTLVTNPSAVGTWDVAYSLTTAGTGSVTSVSVASANGFSGSVQYPSTTPIITLTTSVNGLVKGNGTSLSGAALGTDYVNNSSFVVRENPSGSVNGSNTTFTLANTPTTNTEQVFLNGLLQEPGAGNDYTISGNTITYLTAPLTGDRIRVTYMK